jgi:hypothetical protein
MRETWVLKKISGKRVPIQRIAPDPGDFFVAPGEIQPGRQIMKAGKTKKRNWLYADEYLKKCVDYSAMSVCRDCFEIYGPWRYKQHTAERPNIILWQFCHPDCSSRNKKPGIRPKGGAEEKWPTFDFNTIVELCYCCGQEVLSSGSRWSVWFCEECKKKVVNFNTKFQQTVIPIGRHSLMAGYGLGGRHVRNPKKIEAFVSNVEGLFARIETLDDWRKIVVAENFRAVGYSGDVLLIDYLEGVKAKLKRGKTFDSLVKFLHQRARETGKV